jgi:hypothetical protein
MANSIMPLAPIALFVYKRRVHVQKVIESLKNNTLAGESDLVIFSDGAKNAHDEVAVNQVRDYIKSINGFKSVEIFESPQNKGLANSIVAGVSRILNQYENVIVLEDDLVTSRHFLSFMNQGLTLYTAEERVISIHGYMYPIGGKLPASFFIRGADCWGWATWRRGWAHFEDNGEKLLVDLKERKLTREFDFNGGYPFTKMLEDQIEGKNDSWAIRWMASAFLKDKLTLYPGVSHVQNIGFDGMGTHTNQADVTYDTSLQQFDIKLEKLPIQENKLMRSRLSIFFKQTKKTLGKPIVDKIIKIIKL